MDPYAGGLKEEESDDKEATVALRRNIFIPRTT